MTLVHDLAHARAGDKGDTSSIAVVAYDEAGYRRLSEQLTAERIAAELAPLAGGPVTRHELPDLRAFNFVIEDALAGGVTTSLRLDPHGKSLSSLVLGIELDPVDGATDD